jgi:hypothetical protein
MWHLSSSFSVFLLSIHRLQRSLVRTSRYRFALALVSGLSFGVLAPLLTPTAVQAQAQSQAVPTVRYAQGEDIGLDEIIAEWRSYYADVPVYLCTCQEDTCDQTQQWPYREYDRYQLGVALGPNNGKIAEASGANCFDIADGSRPDKPRSFSSAQTGSGPTSAAASPDNNPPSRPPIAPSRNPEAPATTPPGTAQVPRSVIPTATTINNGAAIRLDWPSGASDVVAVTGSSWNVNVLKALDCERGETVNEKTLTAQRVIGEPTVNSVTGNVAVPVLLASCIETDQSAIFILDPTEGGGYALYRVQLPGVDGGSAEENRNFPNEFSTYALRSLKGVRYWDGSLLVRHGSASGAEALVIFRSDRTPAGFYAGCGITLNGEGADRLCPER